MLSSHTLVGLAALLCACSTGSSSSGSILLLPAGSARSTGLAIGGDVLAATGHHALFRVSEFSQGPQDVNGDGDDGDELLHLLELATGTTRNLDVRGQSVSLGDTHLAVLLDERLEGRDVSGDGLESAVLLVEDLQSGARVLHEFEADTFPGAPLFLEGRWVVLPRSSENVLAFDVLSGERLDLGFPILSFAPGIAVLEDERVAFVTSELTDDLNADGDTGDLVIVVFDLRVRLSRILPYSSLGADLQLDGSLLYLRAVEVPGIGAPPDGGADLNGDGDKEDVLAILVDLATDASYVLPGQATGFPLARFAGDFAAVLVRELDLDLNGDGVIEIPGFEDSTLIVVDLVAGTQRNVGLTVHPEVVMGERYLAFAVDEFRQGGLDLDGDGDADDFVAHVHDLVTGETRNLGLAISPFCFCALQLVGSNLVLLAGPAGSAPGGDTAGPPPGEGRLFAFDLARGIGRDLGFRPVSLLPVPADGSAGDRVVFVLPRGGSEHRFEAHVYDAVTRRTTNTRLQSFDLHVLGSRFVGAVDEFSGEDLNGDGDARDRVVFYGEL